MTDAATLLTPARVRALANRLGVRPTKAWGQNFVVDPGTVRKIARVAEVGPDDVVLEIGPGLGSLTLGLLATGASVIAVEIDPALVEALTETVADLAPEAASRLHVVAGDALRVTELPLNPTALVANLPYNVAVPAILTALERFPTIRHGLVMVQAEVADRLAAPPGSRTYGVPSVKIAWHASARRVATIGPSVFWPVPRVESALVRIERRDPPQTEAVRSEVFACVDAAFSQRRKTLRAALADWAGSAAIAETLLRSRGIDPSRRGESLDVTEFASLAQARREADVDGA